MARWRGACNGNSFGQAERMMNKGSSVVSAARFSVAKYDMEWPRWYAEWGVAKKVR